MKTKKLLSLVSVLCVIGLSWYIVSCQRHQDDVNSQSQPVVSNDYASLTVRESNYVVGHISGSPELIGVGISESAKYIDSADTKLIQKFEQARADKTIIAVWAIAGKNGKVRIVKIGLPTPQEVKAYEDMFIPPATEKNAKSGAINATATFANYTAVSNAFNYVNNLSCSSSNVTGCIPFAYIADGCYARAHAMKRAIENTYSGKTCDKIFFIGRLVGKNSSCCTEWRYHVAPLVYVGSTQYVLDPSTFSGPVSPTVWQNKMLSIYDCVSLPYGSTYIKNGSVYSYNYMNGTYGYDNSYSNTDATLAAYRYNSGCIWQLT